MTRTHPAYVEYLEDKLTRGRALWLVGSLYDALASKLTIDFTENPDTGKPDRRLEFQGVKRFGSGVYDDEEDEFDITIPGLIGLDVDERAGYVRYVLTFGTIEMEVIVSAAPEIQRLDQLADRSA